jgi:hypothetical protein
MSGEAATYEEFSMPEERAQLIEIKIKKINQLFNSFDPSPFLEKDLDDDAFEYIVSSVSEHSHKTKQKILIHLPSSQRKKMSEVEIRKAIHNYFEYKKILAERSIKLKLKEGQFSLIIGIVFLASCLLVREWFIEMPSISQSVWTYIMIEGLMIGGWVAMWKPISDILYEWWPIYKEKNIFKKITEMDIEFRYT